MNVFPLTQVLARKVVTVPAGTTVTAVEGADVNDASRIVGVVQSNIAVSVKIYQGSGLDPTNLEFMNATVSVTASTTEGAGSAFDFSSVGSSVRVDIVNATEDEASVNIYVATKGL